MIEAVKGGLDALKGAFDILQGMRALQAEQAVNAAVIDVQRALLDAMSALQAAQQRDAANLDRIKALEQEIMRLKDWQAERQRYQLAEIAPGAFAYLPKPGVQPGQPPHWLCAQCFDQGHRSLMQFQGAHAGSLYRCAGCRAEFRVPATVRPGSPPPLSS